MMLQVRGSFHQAAEHFSAKTRGRQCTLNALVAIAASIVRSPYDWTEEYMNYILLKGDCLFHKYFGSKQTAVTLLETLVVTEVLIKGNKIELNFIFETNGEALFGVLSSSMDPSLCVPSYTLVQAMDVLFDVKGCSGCLLVLAEYTVSVIKGSKHHYLVFDSHSRNGYGLFDPSGTSTLVFVGKSHSHVEDFIKHLASSLNLPDTTQFEMVGVIARK